MTDHCPLCNIMNKTVNNARVARIAHLIQEYNIVKVIHISGRQNCLPHYLSRYPRGPEDDLLDIDYGLRSKDNSVPTTPLPPELLVNMILRPRNKKQLPPPETITPADIATGDDTSFCCNPSHLNQKNTARTFSANHFDITRLKDEQKNPPPTTITFSPSIFHIT